MKKYFYNLFLMFILIIIVIGCTFPGKSSINNDKELKTNDIRKASANSVWNTGQYRNLFMELGYSQIEVDAKIEDMKDRFFYGTDEQKLYYENGDEAYIFDSGNNDVRSEGMSYGMMAAVQLNLKDEFDKLWNWAKKYMQHQSGDRMGYFAWQCSTSGDIMDQNPAPDGDEYFAMALYFAWKRWGDASYKTEADYILDCMLHQGERADQYSSVYSMFNEFSDNKMICFVPYGDSAKFTDPSYHLPAFYELFALWADKDNDVWANLADESRAFFKTTINSITGLGPDYAEYDGSPKAVGDHADFRFDAWRTTMNIAVDYYWWGEDSWAVTHADTIQSFFEDVGISTHGNQFSLTGEQLSADHSPGLVAMNAVASFNAGDTVRAKKFVQELWDISPTEGQYRYYDGCLYMFAMLHLSGNFKIWGRDNSSSSSSSTSSSSSESSSSSISSSSESSSSSLSSSSDSSSSSEDGIIIDYIIDNDWGSGSVIQVIITNNTDSNITDWTLEWDFPGNQTLSGQWNAVLTQTGEHITAEPVSHNESIPIGENVDFGFQYTYSGENNKPDVFIFNGINISSSSSTSSSSSSVSSSSSSSSSLSSSESSSSSTSSSSSSSTDEYTTISIPHVYDGAGEYFWKTSAVPNYINSWNLDTLIINGTDITNTWISGSNLPAKQDGYYYIQYKCSVSWGHFEAK